MGWETEKQVTRRPSILCKRAGKQRTEIDGTSFPNTGEKKRGNVKGWLVWEKNLSRKRKGGYKEKGTFRKTIGSGTSGGKMGRINSVLGDQGKKGKKGD